MGLASFTHLLFHASVPSVRKTRAEYWWWVDYYRRRNYGNQCRCPCPCVCTSSAPSPPWWFSLQTSHSHITATALLFAHLLCKTGKMEGTRSRKRTFKGPFTLCVLRLRFVFAHNVLNRSLWCCDSRTVWTLPLSPVQPISCDKNNRSRNRTMWTCLKEQLSTTSRVFHIYEL